MDKVDTHSIYESSYQVFQAVIGNFHLEMPSLVISGVIIVDHTCFQMRQFSTLFLFGRFHSDLDVQRDIQISCLGHSPLGLSIEGKSMNNSYTHVSCSLVFITVQSSQFPVVNFGIVV